MHLLMPLSIHSFHHHAIEYADAVYLRFNE